LADIPGWFGELRGYGTKAAAGYEKDCAEDAGVSAIENRVRAAVLRLPGLEQRLKRIIEELFGTPEGVPLYESASAELPVQLA
jgi:hypothetical protein